MLVSQSPGAQRKPISLSKQQKQGVVLASRQQWGQGTQGGEQVFSAGKIILVPPQSFFSLRTLYWMTQTTKRPCLYWKGQSKICSTSHVHFSMSEFGKGERTRQGHENRNGYCPSRTVRQQELPIHNTSTQFSSSAFPQGLVDVRIKMFSLPLVVDFQPWSTWLTTVQKKQW